MSTEENASGSDYQERRRNQRFIAKRDGETCFWILMDGQRKPLNDLSLSGFGIPGAAEDATPREFDFELRLEGIPDKIRGVARIVNHVPNATGGQIGCRFVSFQGDGEENLKEWLTTHVIWSSSVRLSEKEAAAIVSGPSMI
ncbi:MAG: PilZ domain-containing protein [Betaproteobacteria bacterium]|nr:PilZ domain-containing protein [Betaproteobacteria bacterium]